MVGHSHSDHSSSHKTTAGAGEVLGVRSGWKVVAFITEVSLER